MALPCVNRLTPIIQKALYGPLFFDWQPVSLNPLLMAHIVNMAGSKVHSSAAQYQSSRTRLLERSSKTGLRERLHLPTEKRHRAMSQETSLRVPPTGMDSGRDDGEIRVRDFQDNKSIKSTKSHAAPARDVSPLTEPMPTSPDFGTISSADDESAPPPPDFTRRGMHIPSRTR